jgi:hypothetical protein
MQAPAHVAHSGLFARHGGGSQAIAGEVAQTAVRATVWNVIGALFRGFR